MSSKFKFANEIRAMRRPTQTTKILMFAMIIATAILIYDRKDVLPMDLTQFQWKNRLLLLFAPNASHPDFKKWQSDIAKQTFGVDDRDLIVFEIVLGR